MTHVLVMHLCTVSLHVTTVLFVMEHSNGNHVSYKL